MLDEPLRFIVPAAHRGGGLPAAVLAVDAVERPGGGVIGALDGRCSGRQAQDVHRSVARGEGYARVMVIVAVEHELGTFSFEDGLEPGRILELAALRRQARDRRVMDEHHPIVAALSEIAKYLGEVGELERSEPAAGTVISLRHSARYADERDIQPVAGGILPFERAALQDDPSGPRTFTRKSGKVIELKRVGIRNFPYLMDNLLGFPTYDACGRGGRHGHIN